MILKVIEVIGYLLGLAQRRFCTNTGSFLGKRLQALLYLALLLFSKSGAMVKVLTSSSWASASSQAFFFRSSSTSLVCCSSCRVSFVHSSSSFSIIRMLEEDFSLFSTVSSLQTLRIWNGRIGDGKVTFGTFSVSVSFSFSSKKQDQDSDVHF